MSFNKLKRLSQQTAYAATAAAAGAAGAASEAAADAMPLTPFTAGFKLELGPSGDGVSQVIDINNDWIPDFRLEVFKKNGKTEVATITGLNSLGPKVEVVDRKIDQSIQIGGSQDARIFVSDENGDNTGLPFVRTFEPGSEVFTKNPPKGTLLLADPEKSLESDLLSSQATFYDGDTGPLGDSGDQGYVGLVLDIFSGPLVFDDVNAQAVLAVDGEVTEYEGEPIHVGVPAQMLTRFFGWLDVERGSLIVSSGQTQRLVPGAPAPIPAVPEPASLPLMALGAVGLLALRRKMAA